MSPPGILLKNALCATLSPATLERGDLRVADGCIAARGANLGPEPGDLVEDLDGLLVMPGLVCAHTHLYSSLARGMPRPGSPPRGFVDLLRSVWWRLDRALDPETVHFSAVAGALEAARCGVTTIVDHHASPNAIRGSLAIVERALRQVGLRGILCYETSDRDGTARRDEGLRENEEFLSSHRGDERVRGLVGAHASFTLSDESLALLGEMAERLDAGVHIHLAEDRADVDLTLAAHGAGIVGRFRAHGLLRERSVFAHCTHLSEADFGVLRAAGPWLVHNPRSNMNNAVGRAPLHLFGDRAALGTDGFPPDMFEEARAAYLANQEAATRAEDPARLLPNGQRLVSEVFGRPFGALAPGSPADLAVLDYAPPTPMTAENLPGHATFGFRSSMVRSVMVAGRWVLRDGTFPDLDEHGLLRGAREAARKLWSAMDG